MDHRGLAPIEWCIGEPMPVYFYRILQYTISSAYTNTLQHNILIITQHNNIPVGPTPPLKVLAQGQSLFVFLS